MARPTSFGLTGVPDSSGRVEGFGLVYLEAAAGGFPVWRRHRRRCRPVLADETGLLVPPSIDAIAQPLRSLPKTPTPDPFSPPGPRTCPRLSWERCAAETYRCRGPHNETMTSFRTGTWLPAGRIRKNPHSKLTWFDDAMKPIALTAVFLALAANIAHAENCGKSREYLLGNLSGDLALPPQAYEDSFKICLATAAMAMSGRLHFEGWRHRRHRQTDSVAATAATLSHFATPTEGHPALLTHKNCSTSSRS